MQLKKISGTLASAACALLGAPVHAADTDAAKPWIVDTALLLYSEGDGRVQAVEPMVNLRKDYGDERVLNLRLTLDGLTGASPNGATATDRVQTFTGPSGESTYHAAAGETPLDESFRDTRAAVNVNWSQPWGERNKISLGANLSGEYDFQSVAVNGNIARDYNQRNTTLSAGLALEFDNIKPVGATPLAGSDIARNLSGADETRTVADLLFGVTQVLSPRLLTQLNLSVGQSDGYLNDPYKLLSVVDAGTGATTGYLHESRPDARSRQSLYWQTKYALGEDVIEAGYRYYTDDWGIDSHTVDLSYRWQFGGGKHYLQPQLRFYTQSAADFYRHSLVGGIDTDGGGNLIAGQHASADPRLAEFDATTIGIKYGYAWKEGHEFSLRVAQYRQSGNDHPADAIGLQRSLDLFAETTATLAQIGYSFVW